MSKKKDLAQSSKFKMKALPLDGERKIRVIATSPIVTGKQIGRAHV